MGYLTLPQPDRKVGRACVSCSVRPASSLLHTIPCVASQVTSRVGVDPAWASAGDTGWFPRAQGSWLRAHFRVRCDSICVPPTEPALDVTLTWPPWLRTTPTAQCSCGNHPGAHGQRRFAVSTASSLGSESRRGPCQRPRVCDSGSFSSDVVALPEPTASAGAGLDPTRLGQASVWTRVLDTQPSPASQQCAPTGPVLRRPRLGIQFRSVSRVTAMTMTISDVPAEGPVL